MGGGPSGLTSEQKQRAKVYSKLKKEASTIKDDYNETLMTFDDDGNLLFKRSDNQHSEVGWGETEEERRKNWALAQNARVVHNHPRGWCFSPEDIQGAQYYGEMWAVTSDRIQIFRWNKNHYSPYENTLYRIVGASRRKEFVEKLQKLYDKVEDRAYRKYYKTHEKPSLDHMTVEQWTQANRRNGMEITKMAQEMARKYFKNHAKEYGYTYTERQWGRE